MKRSVLWMAIVCSYCGLGVAYLWAQDGAALYGKHCDTCHENGQGPGRAILRKMAPEQIVNALEKGAMTVVGSERTPEERRALAEFLSGKSFGNEPLNPIPPSAYCNASSNSFRNSPSGPAWNGWGVTTNNTRFQPGEAAGLTPADVPRLKLKWAFGFPGDTSASAHPAVMGGRVYAGSWGGEVYSLDAKTGCIHWVFAADAGVRSAISLGKAKGGLAAYFGDLSAHMYAVDAATGKQLWKVKVDDYPLARITGSPTLYAGTLYVPVTSHEESHAVDPKYECCKFRGSLVALEAATGKLLWKTYTIAEEPHPVRKNRIGTQLWAPSGAGTWVAPTIDVERKLVYIGTSNNYSAPATATSDAVIALDMNSGKIRWVRQFTESDTWNGGCPSKAPDHSNCADLDSPDSDLASSPILVQLKGGRRILIAAPKSGVYGLDPDQGGKIVWQQRVGKPVKLSHILWGPAADAENLYVAIAEFKRTDDQPDPNVGGGLVAFSLSSGQKLWDVPSPGCGDRRPCNPAQAAAVTAIPGVVFSGSVDGRLRAYSTRDGKVIWEYDTSREFTTVNGVKAKGGSISNAGPAVVDGIVFTNSGYSHHHGIIPGNVLLAFSAD